MNKNTFKIAYCGVMCAFATLIMFASFIPSLTYVMPAISGIVILTVSEQVNTKWAVLTFFSVAALSFLLTPDIESKIFFTLIFGYYPLVHKALRKVRGFAFRLLIKLFVFNVAAVIAYFIATRLFSISNMTEGFEPFGEKAVYAFWGFGNFAFLAYDYSLKQFCFVYDRWLKKRMDKALGRLRK